MTKYIPPTIWTGDHAAWRLVLRLRVEIEYEHCRPDIVAGLQMAERYLLFDKKKKDPKKDPKNYSIMKTATLVSRINGAKVKVHATTEHPASSYGDAVWVDDEGTAYCEVGFETWYFVEDLIEEEDQ